MKFQYKNWYLNNLQLPVDRIPHKSFEWHVSDTKELFESNLKKYETSPHLQNYSKNPIMYEYNNYGFRTPDNFDLKGDGNVFLGCSHTFGIGHYLENVWSHKLSKQIGGKFYNISEPGSGIMTQYRYLNYFKDKIKFKNVFHFLPDECWGRVELLNDADKFINVFLTENMNLEQMNIFNDKQIHLFNYIYIDLIRNICKELNVNYYLITKSWLNIDNINPYHKTMIPARDLMHYYIEEQNELFDIFYFKYKNNITDNVDNGFLTHDIDCRRTKII